MTLWLSIPSTENNIDIYQVVGIKKEVQIGILSLINFWLSGNTILKLILK